LIGGTQGDYLFAGRGVQTLTGGDGSDQFVFHRGTKATITDFEVGQDKLVFENSGGNGRAGYKKADGFDYSDVRVHSVDGNAVIDLPGTHIELVGVTPEQVSAQFFLFA
jgi:Ca2+-binding RTX toxin-like protein